MLRSNPPSHVKQGGFVNLAPYFLAYLENWELPDSEASRSARRLWTGNQGLQRSISALRETLFSRLYLLEVLDRVPKATGLYLISGGEFSSMTPGMNQGRIRPDETPRFVRAVTTGDFDRLLLFPDDVGPEPNLAFFAPYSSNDGQFVLNSLRIPFTPSNDVDSDSDGGCTLAVSERSGNREFMCSNTGCRGKCRPSIIVEGHVRTVLCECS
jgi:hypothetical protein